MAPPSTKIIASVINKTRYFLFSGAEVPSRMNVLSEESTIAPYNPSAVSAFELKAETAPSGGTEYLAYFVGSEGSGRPRLVFLLLQRGGQIERLVAASNQVRDGCRISVQRGVYLWRG